MLLANVYVNLGYFGSETVSILFLKHPRGNSKQVKEDSTDVNNSCVNDNKDLNTTVFGKAWPMTFISIWQDHSQYNKPTEVGLYSKPQRFLQVSDLQDVP